MRSDHAPQTSVTLLERVREVPANPVAWNEFVGRYAPVIAGWCRRWGLQESDAADVTQDVLLLLAKKLRSFTYDPSRSFRGWLKTLAHHAWCDFVRERGRAGVGAGDTDHLVRLLSIEAGADFVERLNDSFDRELLDEAMAHTQLRVEPRTWQAFWQTAIDGKPGADVARALCLTPAAVYQARNRVQGMIQRTIRRLESADEP